MSLKIPHIQQKKAIWVTFTDPMSPAHEGEKWSSGKAAPGRETIYETKILLLT